MKETVPVFVFGLPRSGTTLLSTMLNATGEIYIPEETHYFEMKYRFNRFNITRKRNLRFVDYYFNVFKTYNPYLTGLQLSTEEVNYIRSQSKETSNKSEFLDALCIRKADRKGIRRWGEKTPIHLIHLDLMVKEFPNALFINIIRDPRDVISSIRKIGWKRNFNLKKTLENWRFSVRLAEDKMYRSNVLTIKFEDLVLDSFPTLQSVGAFIGVTISENVIRNFRKEENQNYLSNSEPWKGNAAKPLDPSKVFRWKKNTESFQTQFISWYLEKDITKMGYKKSSGLSRTSAVLYLIWLNIKHHTLNTLIFCRESLR